MVLACSGFFVSARPRFALVFVVYVFARGLVPSALAQRVSAQ